MHADKPMIRPKTIGILILALLIVYQAALMFFWVVFVELDWFLLRISLSFADSLGIAALSLAFYSYLQMYEVKMRYGSYDLDTVEEKRKALNKAGDDLDATEEPRVKVHLTKYNYQGDESGNRLAANGGKEEA
jgi:hypothetical protein